MRTSRAQSSSLAGAARGSRRVAASGEFRQGRGPVTGLAGRIGKYQQTGKLPNYALGIVVGVVVIAIVAFGYRT